MNYDVCESCSEPDESCRNCKLIKALNNTVVKDKVKSGYEAGNGKIKTNIKKQIIFYEK